MNKNIPWYKVVRMWIKRILFIPFGFWFVYVGLVESYRHDHKKPNPEKSKKRAGYILKFVTWMFDGKGTFVNDQRHLENVVFVANHPTVVGSMILEGHLGSNLATMVAEDDQWYIEFWALKKIFTNAGVTFVDRRDTMHRAAALFKVIKHSQAGARVLIFPEGNLTQKDNNKYLEHFHDGPYKIALVNKKPIIPVIETGTFERFQTIPLHLQFMEADIRPVFYFLEPYTKHLEVEMTIEEVRDEIWQLMHAENMKHISK